MTAGLSTPWHLNGVADLPPHPFETKSGLGFELLLRTTEFSDWAISLLNRLMVYQLGTFEGRVVGSVIASGQRIPLLGLGCVPVGSSIEAVAIGVPRDIEPAFTLRTGTVDLLQVVGITREEYAWSVENGVEALVEALSVDNHLLTIFQRGSIPAARESAIPAGLRQHFA